MRPIPVVGVSEGSPTQPRPTVRHLTIRRKIEDMGSGLAFVRAPATTVSDAPECVQLILGLNL